MANSADYVDCAKISPTASFYLLMAKNGHFEVLELLNVHQNPLKIIKNIRKTKRFQVKTKNQKKKATSFEYSTIIIQPPKKSKSPVGFWSKKTTLPLKKLPQDFLSFIKFCFAH